MTIDQRSGLSSLEGRRVNVALADGSRVDDCELVSAGRRQVDSLWLFADGVDRFVPFDDVVELWEALPASTATRRRPGMGSRGGIRRASTAPAGG